MKPVEEGALVPIEKMLKAFYGSLDVDWNDPKNEGEWKASRRIAMLNALVAYIAHWKTREYISDA